MQQDSRRGLFNNLICSLLVIGGDIATIALGQIPTLVFWICIADLVIWGVVFGQSVMLMPVGIKSGIVQRVEMISVRVDGVSSEVKSLSERFENLPERVEMISARVDGVSSEVRSLSERFENLPERVEMISARVDGVSSEVRSLSERFENLPERVEMISAKVENLLERVENLPEQVEIISAKIASVSERVDLLQGSQVEKEERKMKSYNDRYSYPSVEKRHDIVAEYRRARANGEVTNKNAWAMEKYNICDRTLSNYEKEFDEWIETNGNKQNS